MPTWTTPPTFSYGYPASVDDLNIVRNNILYLYGEMFNVSNATLESEVKCDSPFDGEQTAGKLWIEHHADDLYYRIRIKSDANNHNVNLYIKCYESPYVTAGEADLIGTHLEEKLLTTLGTYYLFTNSDAAVDISGWGLTANTMYLFKVSLTADDQDNKDCYVEVQFMYEQG